MQRLLAACLIVALASTSASAQPLPGQAEPDVALRSRLTNDVIKDAVKNTLRDDKKGQQVNKEEAFGVERYENFARDFSEAKVPDCLHSEGLKRQPTFFLTGVLALPFIVVAAVRGKCH